MNPPTDLITQIRSGIAPRKVKEFAAQGILPVPEEELISLQISLTSDPDPEIVEASRKSLQKVPEQTWCRMLEKKDPERDLVWFCLTLKTITTPVKEKILANHSIPDGVIARMAGSETGPMLDLILINHVRLLRDPQILAALERNYTLTLDQKRRLDEFKTEFIIKPQKEKEAQGPAIEYDQDLLATSVEDLLAQIPDLDSDAQKMLREADLAQDPRPSEEEAQQLLQGILGEELQQIPKEILNTYQRILRMKQGEKMRVALLGNKEERGLLVRDTSRMVASMVLRSPKLTDLEMEGFAQQRNIDSDLLRQMGLSRKFTKRYSVIHSLIKNPKTPSPISLNLLKLIRMADLKNLERDKNIPEVIRRQAKKTRMLKEEKKEH
jgi:hypothetical protein